MHYHIRSFRRPQFFFVNCKKCTNAVIAAIFYLFFFTKKECWIKDFASKKYSHKNKHQGAYTVGKKNRKNNPNGLKISWVLVLLTDYSPC